MVFPLRLSQMQPWMCRDPLDLLGCLSSYSFFIFWPRFGHAAYGILVPQPGVEPVPPAVEARRLQPWATREVPVSGV